LQKEEYRTKIAVAWSDLPRATRSATRREILETPKQKMRIRTGSSTNHKQTNKSTGKVKTGTEQENGSRS
jgi:hypothetical protein